MPSTFRARSLQAGLAVLAALALAVPASAALYKWTDATGRTVYSDQPPPPNVKSEIIGGAPPPAKPDAVKDMANREAEFRKRQMDRADDAKKTEKSRAEAQKLATFCTQARTQAAGLRRADIAMYRMNDKGERVELDEAGAEKEREEGDAVWFRGRAYVGEEGVGRLRFAVRPHAAAGSDEAPARA